MNKAYRDYKINNWVIIASEYYNDWELYPVFDNDPNCEKYDNFMNNEEIRFKKLSECKKFVKTKEAEELRNKYNN